MKRAVHFGTDSIRRGFVGERLYASRYEVVFADVSGDLINTISEEQGYELQLTNRDLQSLCTDHVRAPSTLGDKEKLLWGLTHCGLTTTSVRLNNLPKITLSFYTFQAEY